jgi:SAM-dependent methyltransferase
MRYDFGCGKAKRQRCIGVDSDPHSDADIIWDITKHCPHIPDNSAEYVWCSNVLEHIPHPYHLLAMQQILRVLKPGGVFEILVPHPGSDSAMVPDHKHWFTRQYINDVIAPWPEVAIDQIALKKTPYFDVIATRFGMPESMIEDVFRNVATEFIILGHKTIFS